MTNVLDPPTLERRADELFEQHQHSVWIQTDRLFAGLLIFQYVAGILAAIVISPHTWAGLSSETHPHVWAAALLGAAIISLPVYLAAMHPGLAVTRHTIAIAQMLDSALLIHLCGGRIETHFHVFGSLAFLAFYRDWKVLVTATIVVAGDHLIRGIYWPQSVFGVSVSSPWRACEHAGWVLFEDLFLVWSCQRGTQEMRDIARQRAALESTNQVVESQVQQRTAELASSQLELRKSENAIRAIVESAADGIITIDQRGAIESANPAAARLFGYDQRQLAGMNVKSLMPVPYSDNHDGYLNAYLRTGIRKVIGTSSEVIGKRCDGTVFPIELTVSEVRTDGEPRFTGILRDITERRRAEQRQAEHTRLTAFAADIGQALVREDDLRSMLQRSAEAMVRHLDAAFARIWILNEEDQVLELEASAGLYTHLDGPHGRVPVGQFKIGLIAQERVPHLTNAVTSDPRVGDQEWARREGMVAFAGHPLLVQDRVVGVMAMFSRHPLTSSTLTALASVADSLAVGIERVRSEEKLQKALLAAEQASVAKSQFLANMSHELRTPMNAILGYSEMLAEECQDVGQDQFLPDLKKIHTAGKHLLGLINDILDLSKIEAGKMEVFAEEFDLAQFLGEVAVTVRPLMEHKSNTLTVHADGELGRAYTDQTKVRQVLFNLLSNAAKFTERGQITLAARRVEAEGQDWLELSVQDTGIGMNPQQMAKIFEAFTQAEASTTRRFGGTGLGLTITKHFCEMLGGQLAVDSQTGIGSRFTARFPARFVPQARPELAAKSSARPGAAASTLSPRRNEVLVVDDDDDARQLVQRFLQKEGFPVLLASSGAEALQLARQRRPMTILLDVMMPGMDGWAVLAALKEDPATAEIPVVMISMVDNADIGYALGVADYLTKPPDRKRLGDILHRYRADNSERLILIVDDDTNSREMLANLAAKAGCAVREAKNGREALTCIAERPPDLMLLDLMMPEMDGFEVVSELSRQGLGDRFPIIVLTAKDLTEDDRARLDGRVSNIRSKAGFSREGLLHEIRALLDRYRPDGSGAQS